MTVGIHSLSTSGMTPKQQVQCWTDALRDLCGQFHVDPLEASSLEGRINFTTVSRLKLCQIEVSQHRIRHSFSRVCLAAHPYVKVLFQTYGVSYFEQGGRQFELLPGDCFAYDVSAPYTIISPAFTRHELVVVPKDMLKERGLHFQRTSACKLSARTGACRIAHDFVHAAFDEAAQLSPRGAVGVADSLIDLLVLPLREADATFDRGGPEAMHVRAQFFIREHLRDPELCIDRISAELRCSKRYLHMLFRERGTTVSDYIWQARLQNCRQELEAHAGKTITDVAFSWGFSSSSHFSRVFRKFFGVAPSSIHRAQQRSVPSEGPSFPDASSFASCPVVRER